MKPDETLGRELENEVARHDRLLTADELAEALGMTRRWVYRNAGRLPFTVRLSRKALRFSEAGLLKFIALGGLERTVDS